MNNHVSTDNTHRLGMLRKRASLVQAVREFFLKNDFLEVDTPLRLPALIPEANIRVVPSGDWFLQTSPEVCMKRLLAAGLPKIFQICKCFRAAERGRRHVPEFTMLEWYAAGEDYQELMRTCEELLRFLLARLGLPERLPIPIGGKEVAFGDAWERLTVAEAFRRHAPLSAFEAQARGLFDEMLVLHVEPHLGLGRPTFLCDYPAELASLARRREDRPEVAERVELYLGGVELANGFSELADPAEQRNRFESELAVIRADGRDPGPMPERFLGDLEKMPPAAGMALGLDRLAMCLLGADSIDEVLAFIPEDL